MMDFIEIPHIMCVKFAESCSQRLLNYEIYLCKADTFESFGVDSNHLGCY